MKPLRILWQHVACDAAELINAPSELVLLEQLFALVAVWKFAVNVAPSSKQLFAASDRHVQCTPCITSKEMFNSSALG